jgi:uncharacterized membrane protein YoaK (UPF0700 family)
MVEARSRIATRNGLLLALAFAAGYIDALSYLGLSRVFTANMTGNTVLLGIAHKSMAMRHGRALRRPFFFRRGCGCLDCRARSLR